MSFAKYEEAPPGQMASGLRQACVAVGAIRVSGDPEELKPKLVVTAYTNPRNLKSARVLEAAGFVARGEVVYDPGDDPNPDTLYVLDWGRLNEIVHQKSDTTVHQSLEEVT